MAYAVEARVFDNGRIISKIREAKEGEEDSMTVTARCDIWVDVFKSYDDARAFERQYIFPVNQCVF